MAVVGVLTGIFFSRHPQGYMNYQCQMILIVMLSIAISGGCGNVDPPDSLTLYSIDGRDFEPGKEPQTEEKFHGYPVLGKVAIQDFEQRKKIFAALQKGISGSDGTVASCFWPRHAIRTSKHGNTTDYVICFECLQLQIHSGSSTKTEPTTRMPQSVFNKELQDADVPLAPGVSE